MKLESMFGLIHYSFKFNSIYTFCLTMFVHGVNCCHRSAVYRDYFKINSKK